MEVSTRSTSASSNNAVSSTQAVVALSEAPRMPQSDEVPGALVALSNQVGRAGGGRVQRHHQRAPASAERPRQRLVPQSALVKSQASELGRHDARRRVNTHATQIRAHHCNRRQQLPALFFRNSAFIFLFTEYFML